MIIETLFNVGDDCFYIDSKNPYKPRKSSVRHISFNAPTSDPIYDIKYTMDSDDERYQYQLFKTEKSCLDEIMRQISTQNKSC